MTRLQLLALAEQLDELAAWVSGGVPSLDLLIITACRDVAVGEAERLEVEDPT